MKKEILKLSWNEEIFSNNMRTYRDTLKDVEFKKGLLLSLRHHPIYTPTRNAKVDIKPSTLIQLN